MKKKTLIEMIPMHKFILAAFAGLTLASCGGNKEVAEVKTENVTNYSFTDPSPLNFSIVYRDQFSKALEKAQNNLNQSPSKRPNAVVIQAEGVLFPMYNVYTQSKKPKIEDGANKGSSVFQGNLSLAPGALELLRFCQENQIEIIFLSEFDRGIMEPINRELAKNGVNERPAEFFVLTNEEDINGPLGPLENTKNRYQILSCIIADMANYYPSIVNEADLDTQELSKEMYDEFNRIVTIVPVGKYTFK